MAATPRTPWQRWALLPAAVAVYLAPQLAGGSGAAYSAAVLIAIFAVMAYGLDIIVSDLGEVSLAHTVFFAAGSYTTGTSAPLSEAEYSMSEASAAATEIEPAAGGTRQQARALASQGSLDARAAAGGGAALRPEALQRAAAKVQSGSPRRSAVRAKGPFATKVGVAENE